MKWHINKKELAPDPPPMPKITEIGPQRQLFMLPAHTWKPGASTYVDKKQSVIRALEALGYEQDNFYYGRPLPGKPEANYGQRMYKLGPHGHLDDEIFVNAGNIDVLVETYKEKQK